MRPLSKGYEMFKNRSFNVKLVKDEKSEKNPNNNSNIAEKIDAVKAYAEIADNFVADVASTVVKATLIIIFVKTSCDLLKIGMKKLAE
jgi:hypothetical protein